MVYSKVLSFAKWNFVSGHPEYLILKMRAVPLLVPRAA